MTSLQQNAPPSRPDRRAREVTLPRWARAADFVVAFLVLLALIFVVSGGFRARFGSVRLTLTSPLRAVIAAALVALVRHALVRTEPIHRHLASVCRAWWRAPGVRDAFAVLIGTRAPIMLVGYLSVFTFGFVQGEAPLRYAENELVNLPVRWDAGWYLQIALDGYHYIANATASYQQNIVFFPAYPAAMRVVGLLFGNRQIPYVLAGLVVALGAWVGALIYLYILARDLVGDDRARYTLWLVGAYPFAVFYGAIYTESLFLLAAAGAFYHFTRRQWWRAAAWGFVTGLTRPNGCFLSVALALMALAPAMPASLAGGAWTGPHGGASVPAGPAVSSGARLLGRRRIDLRAIAAAAAPGVGVLAYSAYIWWLTGAPLAWAEGHVAWGREYTGLGVLVADHYELITQSGLSAYVSRYPYDFLNALGVIFVLGAAWPVYRRLGLGYAAFILVNILPPLAAGGLLSAGRFSSVLFPAFIWFARWVPDRHRAGWLATFAALQAFVAALFYTWRPMY